MKIEPWTVWAAVHYTTLLLEPAIAATVRSTVTDDSISLNVSNVIAGEVAQNNGPCFVP